jgi:hypothetical protein
MDAAVRKKLGEDRVLEWDVEKQTLNAQTLTSCTTCGGLLGGS